MLNMALNGRSFWEVPPKEHDDIYANLDGTALILTKAIPFYEYEKDEFEIHKAMTVDSTLALVDGDFAAIETATGVKIGFPDLDANQFHPKQTTWQYVSGGGIAHTYDSTNSTDDKVALQKITSWSSEYSGNITVKYTGLLPNHTYKVNGITFFINSPSYYLYGEYSKDNSTWTQFHYSTQTSSSSGTMAGNVESNENGEVYIRGRYSSYASSSYNNSTIYMYGLKNNGLVDVDTISYDNYKFYIKVFRGAAGAQYGMSNPQQGTFTGYPGDDMLFVNAYTDAEASIYKPTESWGYWGYFTLNNDKTINEIVHETWVPERATGIAISQTGQGLTLTNYRGEYSNGVVNGTEEIVDFSTGYQQLSGLTYTPDGSSTSTPCQGSFDWYDIMLQDRVYPEHGRKDFTCNVSGGTLSTSGFSIYDKYSDSSYQSSYVTWSYSGTTSRTVTGSFKITNLTIGATYKFNIGVSMWCGSGTSSTTTVTLTDSQGNVAFTDSETRSNQYTGGYGYTDQSITVTDTEYTFSFSMTITPGSSSSSSRELQIYCAPKINSDLYDQKVNLSAEAMGGDYMSLNIAGTERGMGSYGSIKVSSTGQLYDLNAYYIQSF